jgi:hypothetical protein
MNHFRRCLGAGTLVLSASGADISAQASYSPLEFQFGVQLPFGLLYRDQFTRIKRGPGPNFGLMLYSRPELPMLIRLRGDFAATSLAIADAQYPHSLSIKEFSLGVDAAPRIIRISVRDVEARFYAGVALRVMGSGGDDVTVLEDRPGGFPSASALPYDVGGFGAVGRAGWFVRRASKPSPFRLDLGYQIGEVNGVIQHDLLLRVGVGS